LSIPPGILDLAKRGEEMQSVSVEDVERIDLTSPAGNLAATVSRSCRH
jgi:hypothetical protein